MEQGRQWVYRWAVLTRCARVQNTLGQMDADGAYDLLVHRFSALSPFSESERSALDLRTQAGRFFHPAETILSQGAQARRPGFIVSGWAGEIRDLRSARRQIIGMLLPGDPVGLERRADALAPAHVIALSPVHTIDAPEIATTWRERDHAPGIARALDLAAAEREWFRIAQIMRLGRQTALERVASLFLELEYRLSARGLAHLGSFKMPLTQPDLADATGMSVVHFNRTLQAMRSRGLIELARGRLALLNMEGLQELAELPRPVLVAENNADT